MVLGFERFKTSWGWRSRGPFIHGAVGILMGATLGSVERERSGVLVMNWFGFGVLEGYGFREEDMVMFGREGEKKRVAGMSIGGYADFWRTESTLRGSVLYYPMFQVSTDFFGFDSYMDLHTLILGL